MYKAALDNMAGEAVSALFATMADRAKGIDVDGPGKEADTRGTGLETCKGGGGDRQGSAESQEPGQRRSANQDGEEENGPPRNGDSGNQQAEGEGKRSDVANDENVDEGTAPREALEATGVNAPDASGGDHGAT